MLTLRINVSYLPAGANLVVPLDFEWETKQGLLPGILQLSRWDLEDNE